MKKYQRWDLVFQIADLVDEEHTFAGKQDFLGDFLQASLRLFFSTTDGQGFLSGLKVTLSAGATAVPMEAIPSWWVHKHFHASINKDGRIVWTEGLQYEAWCTLNALVKEYA